MEDRPDSLGHQEPVSSKLAAYRLDRACRVAPVAAAWSFCPALLAIGVLPLPRNGLSQRVVAACTHA